jgi:HD superfamily phosphodiesterase
MSKFPTVKEAEKLMSDGLADIKKLEPNASDDRINTIRIHTKLVADAARAIAEKIPDMDADKAYIYGLLHDYGKVCGYCTGNKTFHGLAGYYKLMEMDLPEIAKISVTHTFFDKNFSIDDYVAYQKEDLIKIKEIIQDMEYTDYDKLIQLCDLLVNNIDGYNPISERLERLRKWYNIPEKCIDLAYRQSMETKKYFEEKCKCDIYKLLNIKKTQEI